MNKNERGFTAVEAVLIVVVVSLLAGVGWYVYRMNNKDDKKEVNTSQADDKKTENKPAEETDSKTYVTVKEWNLRAEYSGKPVLLYVINEQGNATFSTKDLEKNYKGCTAENGVSGMIRRLKPTDGTTVDGDAPTAQDAAKTNPDYVKVGDYYYHYVGPQSVCGDPEAPAALLVEANAAVKSLVPKLKVAE